MEVHRDGGWRLGSLSFSIPSPGWGVTTGDLSQQLGAVSVAPQPAGSRTNSPSAKMLAALLGALLNLIKPQAGRPSPVI